MSVSSEKKHIVRAVISKVIHIEEDVPVKLLLTDEEKQEFDSMSTQEQAMWLRSKGALPFEDILGEEDEGLLEDLLGMSDDPLMCNLELETIIGDVVEDTIEVSEWDGIEGTIEEFGMQFGVITESELELLDGKIKSGDTIDLFQFYLDSLKQDSDATEPITLQNTEFTEEELGEYLDTLIKHKGD